MKKKEFDIKAFEKSAKALADCIDGQYPKLRPPEAFIWSNEWIDRGIEEKLEILYSALQEIYNFLNTKKGLK